MISLPGGVLSGDATIRRALEASLALLKGMRAPSGSIPNNVDAETLRPNFRAYADGGLWWIVGSSILRPDPECAQTVLRWYECQDVDQTGLLSIQESSDWEDLFCTRGKALYVNCLYVLALRKAAEMEEVAGGREAAARYRERAALVSAQVNRFLWYSGDGSMFRHISHSFSTASQDTDSLGRKRWMPVKRILPEEEYYLPYLGFRAVGEWFDTLGNLIAVLAGVAQGDRAQKVLGFIERYGLAEHPAKSLYPAVQPGDPDWRDYYAGLNIPDQYHNGGIWPFIGGFYVAALVHCGEHEKARSALERLAALNLRGGFNEWHHGATVEPMGVTDQAWSAGMYLYAFECAKAGRLLLF
jgi:GH15 family glucan-1,4-alpha-glucosidase